MADWSGQVAVITGGASGIGLALARRLGREGVRLVIADVEQPALEKAVAGLKASGLSVIGVPTDVADAAQMQALAAQSFAHFGAVHFLFNNAGIVIGECPNVWEISDNTWRWYLDVNLMGMVHGAQAFVPRLLAQGAPARIINTIAHAGYLLNHPMVAAYGVSKAAAGSFTETLALQLAAAKAPIRVHAFLPGPHTVPTQCYTSARNRPAHLPPEPHEPSPRIASVEEMQAYFRATIGRERDTTSAEEAAEQAVQGILAGTYWINAMSDRFARALCRHHAAIQSGADPAMPDNVF